MGAVRRRGVQVLESIFPKILSDSLRSLSALIRNGKRGADRRRSQGAEAEPAASAAGGRSPGRSLSLGDADIDAADKRIESIQKRLIDLLFLNIFHYSFQTISE